MPLHYQAGEIHGEIKMLYNNYNSITNCTFNDTSMKFGTLLEYTFLTIFGYRPIADLTCDKIGSHFPIWPPSLFWQKRVCLENMWCTVVVNGF